MSAGTLTEVGSLRQPAGIGLARAPRSSLLRRCPARDLGLGLNRAQQRAAAGALIGGHQQFLDTIASDRRDDPELGKMGADRIDHSCLPADEQMARAIERQVRNALAFSQTQVSGVTKNFQGQRGRLSGLRVRGLRRIRYAIDVGNIILI
jgi:hypothetical protein